MKKKKVEAAKELLKVINSTINCTDMVKINAKNILNSQLKLFSPSLNEKIVSLYKKFEKHVKRIIEQEDKGLYRISKFYIKEEFKKKLCKFTNIRNEASHNGIIWNEGWDFLRFKFLIYFSVLNRVVFL